MTQQEIILHWKQGAQDSLEVAELCFKAKKYDHALFAAHLCVEKSLKARFIEEHDDAAPKTHELHELATELSLPWTQEQMDILREMSRLAVRARYGDHVWAEEQVNPQNVRQWIDEAKNLISFILP